ncbi:MAG: hypothetical protein WCA46_11370 [Actinocatenispora sp.]
MTTTMKLRKHGGALVLDGPGTAASLTTDRVMRRGTITVNGAALPVEVNDRWRSGVTVGGGSPVLRLDPRQAYVPGGAEPVSWEVSRGLRGYGAAVSRAHDRIELWLPRFHGKSVRVSVTGNWAHLELVALAACFGLLARRRGDSLQAVAVSGAIGHGQ